MSTLADRLVNQNYCYWLKAALCLQYVKEGLEKFTEEKSQELHNHVLNGLRSSGNPSVNGICPDATIIRCRVDCSCCKCQGYIDELKTYLHTINFSPGNLNNSNIHDWNKEPWQLAKVFMNPGQGVANISPCQTDISGLVNFIDHCTVPRRDLLNDHNIAKIRTERNLIMHTADMQMDQQDFQRKQQLMIDFLKDLPVRPEVKRAIEEIQKVNMTKFRLTKENEKSVLEKLGAEIHERLADVKEELLTLRNSIDDSKQSTDEEAKQLQEKLQQEIQMRTEEMKKVQTTHEHLKNKIKDDKHLLNELELQVRQLHNSLEKTNKNLLSVQRDFTILQSRVEKQLDANKQQMNELKEQSNKEKERIDLHDAIIDSHSKMIHVLDTKVQLQLEKPSLQEEEFKNLQESLVALYKRRYDEVCMSPLYEGLNNDALRVSLDELDTDVTIVRPSKKALNKEEELKSYSDMFHTEGKKNNIIFIKGEAGTGKSTLCRRFLHAWCKSHSNDSDHSHQNSDSSNDMEEAMSHFDYLFFVPLRYVKESTTSIDSILSSMLQKFSVSDKIFDNIIKANPEQVLIIFDGFDEYSEILDYEQLNHKCTVITTTRPWKYDKFCEENPTVKVDAILKLDGLKGANIDTFTDKFITCYYNSRMNRSDQDHQYDLTKSCLTDIKAVGLAQNTYIPLILMIMILCWLEKRENGESLSRSLTCNMLDMLQIILRRGTLKSKDSVLSYKKMKSSLTCTGTIPECLSKYKILSEYHQLLLKLGELAYSGLRATDKKMSLVFTEDQVDKYLTETDQEICFKFGFLSKAAISLSYIEEARIFMSFYHMLFQEFFAALWIVCGEVTHDEVHADAIWHMKQGFTCINDVFEVENVVRFISGLSPTKGSQLAMHIADMVDQYKDTRDFQYTQHEMGDLRTLTMLLARCSNEVDKNTCNIYIGHVCLRYINSAERALSVELIDRNRDNLRSVIIWCGSFDITLRQELMVIKSISDAKHLQEIVLEWEIGDQYFYPKSPPVSLSEHSNLRVLDIRRRCPYNLFTSLDLPHNCNLEILSCTDITMTQSNWDNFFLAIQSNNLRRLCLSNINTPKTAILDLEKSIRLEHLVLEKLNIDQIKLSCKTCLTTAVIDDVTMPASSWDIFFESLQSTNTSVLVLKNLQISHAVFCLKPGDLLNNLLVENVAISAIKISLNAGLTQAKLINVRMASPSWNEFFELLQSQHMSTLELKHLNIDEVAINLENITMLDRLLIEDVSMSAMNLLSTTRLSELVVRRVKMPKPSWNKFFQTLQLKNIRELKLVSLDIGDAVIELSNITQLSTIVIWDVKLSDIKLPSTANVSSLSVMKLFNVTMPRSSWHYFLQQLQSEHIGILELVNLNICKSVINLEKSTLIDELVIRDVNVSAIQLSRTTRITKLALRNITMPMPSWNNFFETVQLKYMSSLKMENLTIDKVVVSLDDNTILNRLLIDDVSMSAIKLSNTTRISELELFNVTMSQSAWNIFFDSLNSEYLTYLILWNLNNGDAVVSLGNLTALRYIQVEHVKMSKATYDKINSDLTALPESYKIIPMKTCTSFKNQRDEHIRLLKREQIGSSGFLSYFFGQASIT